MSVVIRSPIMCCVDLEVLTELFVLSLCPKDLVDDIVNERCAPYYLRSEAGMYMHVHGV